jgi:peptidoglycan/LPS O-acetylase OafA/YrhL
MRYEYLQFAKGYAIFTIMLFHVLQRLALPEILQKAIIFGGTGVHLFFLLSGFGLALSKSSDSIIGFYRRRLLKVWVPYILALTLSLATAITLQLFPDRWAAWAAGVGGWQMFFPEYIESFGGHYWFISAIIQFYLVFPLLQKLYSKLNNPLLFCLLCLAVSVGWWILVFALDKGGVRTWNSCFLQFLWEFALGMALAKAIPKEPNTTFLGKIRDQYWQPSQWYKWILGGVVGAVIMIAMILKTGKFGPVFNDIPALAGYGMLSVGIYFFCQRYFTLANRFFLWVGEYSFAIYLIHILVLNLLILCLSKVGIQMGLLWIPVFVVLACAAGWGFGKGVKWLKLA